MNPTGQQWSVDSSVTRENETPAALPILYGEHPPLSEDAACVLCGSRDRPVSDHCHTHGWVRGVLCRSCNYFMRYVDERIRPGSGAPPTFTTWDALAAYAARCSECPPVGITDLQVRTPIPGHRRERTRCVKFSDAEEAAIDQEAIADRLTHASGEPIRSAIVRRLVAEAIEARRAGRRR